MHVTDYVRMLCTLAIIATSLVVFRKDFYHIAFDLEMKMCKYIGL